MKIIFNHKINEDFKIEGFIDVAKQSYVIDVIDLKTEKKTEDESILDSVKTRLDTELFAKLIAYCTYINPYHTTDINFDDIMYEFNMKRDLHRKKISQFLASQKKENKKEYRIEMTQFEHFCFA